MADIPQLVLASGSPWRRQLLDRLGVAYTAISPDIDESRAPGEAPDALVRRLAREKAEAVAAHHPDALVIGSDQVAALDDAILGKPGTREHAIEQLRRQSGRRVDFLTGVCLCRPQREPLVDVVMVRTCFRAFDNAEIERYVDAENVTATAGSIKSEGLGITLVDSIDSNDPTALVGLPLITLRRMLAESGYPLP